MLPADPVRGQRLLGGHMIFVTSARTRPASTDSSRWWPNARSRASRRSSTVTRRRSNAPDATLVDFLSFEEMVETIRRARSSSPMPASVRSWSRSRTKAPDRRPSPEVVRRGGRRSPAPARPTLRPGRGMVTLVETPEALADALGREQAACVRSRRASSLTAGPSRLHSSARSGARSAIRARMTTARAAARRTALGVAHPQRPRLEGGLAGNASDLPRWWSRSSSRGCLARTTGVSPRW